MNKYIALFITCALLFPFSAHAALRDPTKPLLTGTAAIKGANLSLQAIFTSGAQTVAVINSQTLSRGDELMGWTVERISKSGVRLRKQEQVKTLNLRVPISNISK